jgi:type II secretory pathway pseudopilin PulG
MKKNSDNRKRTPSFQAELPNGSPAFTLTELVVVIGVIALLAAMLLPALAQSQMKSQAIVCLSNMRQLQRAAMLYANDNSDFLPKNYPLYQGGDSATGKPCWVDGTMGWAGSPDMPAGCSTNPFYLGVNGLTGGNPVVTLIGSIGPYAKSAAVYHCPADHYIDPTYHVLRVRSCSANLMIGCPSGNSLGADTIDYKAFEKYSDFGSPLGPSQCFEFLDENPVSLNDGWFEYALDGSYNNDWPAINHELATSFSFADGHTELHRWHDVFLNPSPAYTNSGADTIWLAQHGTYRIQ